MEISVTEAARGFLRERGTGEVTVSSLVISSCCGGPLPPEVKPGAPADPEGFAVYQVPHLDVFFDSLLDPRPEIVIDLKSYGNYRELFVQGWE